MKDNYPHNLKDQRGQDVITLPIRDIPKFAEQAHQIVNPGIDPILRRALWYVLSDKGDEIAKELFDSNPSYKRDRDGIAHGNISEQSAEAVERVTSRNFRLEQWARNFIFGAIDRLHDG